MRVVVRFPPREEGQLPTRGYKDIDVTDTRESLEELVAAAERIRAGAVPEPPPFRPRVLTGPRRIANLLGIFILLGWSVHGLVAGRFLFPAALEGWNAVLAAATAILIACDLVCQLADDIDQRDNEGIYENVSCAFRVLAWFCLLACLWLAFTL